MSTAPLQIDIVSDVVCPWCVIGFKQLEVALGQFPVSLAVNIDWHPFELNPAMADGGQNMGEHIAQKYGSSPEQSAASRKQLAELGASLGFAFNFSDESRIYNTFKAHQLLHWARRYNKQMALKMQLFSAYFNEQKAVDRIDILLETVEQVGLDSKGALTVLENETYAEAVRNAESLWQEQGIHGVPAFILNKKYLISGAQGADVFKIYIDKLLDEAKAVAD